MASVRYATVDQVIENLAIGSDVDPATFLANAAGLDEDRIAVRIAKAAADVDTSLYPVYDTPFTEPVAELVTDLTVALAAFFCTGTYNDSDPIEESNPVRLDYSWARQRMIDIVAGRAGIPGVEKISRDPTGGVIVDGTGMAGIPRNPHPRLFGADMLTAGSYPASSRPWFDPRW